MTQKMKKKNRDFPQIGMLKERQMIRILEQEMKLKSSLRELSDNLTGAKLKDRIQDNLFSGSGLAFKLGFMAVSLLTERFKRRRKK
jgi:hypothetical protein